MVAAVWCRSTPGRRIARAGLNRTYLRSVVPRGTLHIAVIRGLPAPRSLGPSVVRPRPSPHRRTKRKGRWYGRGLQRGGLLVVRGRLGASVVCEGRSAPNRRTSPQAQQKDVRRTRCAASELPTVDSFRGSAGGSRRCAWQDDFPLRRSPRPPSLPEPVPTPLDEFDGSCPAGWPLPTLHGDERSEASG